MSSISVKSIKIENFKSFSEKQELELPRNGLILLEAEAYNGSSSGVGKSSLLNSFDYVFNGSYTRVQTHWYCPPGIKSRVSIVLKKDSDEVVIDKSTGDTSLWINGTKTPGGVKVTMAAIEDLLEIDTTLIPALTHKRQRQRDENSFLKSSDSEKKEFLSKVLGLDTIESILKTSSDKAKECDTLAEKVKTIVEELKKELAELKPIEFFDENLLIQTEELFNIKKTEWTNFRDNKDKKRHELSIHLENLKIEQNKIEKVAEEKLKALSKTTNSNKNLETINSRLKEIKNQIEVLVKENNEKIVKIEKELKTYEDQKTILQKLAFSKTQLIVKKDKLTKEIEHIKTGVCPLCSREWKDGHAIKTIEEKQHEIDLINIDITDADSAALEIIELNQKIELSKSKIKTRSGTIPEVLVLSDEKSKLEEKLKNIENQFQTKLQSQKNEIITQKNVELEELQKKFNFSELSFEIEFMEKRERELNEGVVVLYERINQLKNEKSKNANDVHNYNVNRNKIIDKLKTQENELKTLQTTSALEKDFKIAMGNKGFLGAIIEEILVEISDKINEFIATIPNISGLSVKIENKQESENLVKPKIAYSIFKENFRVDVTDLSEGQRSSLDFVTFLSVREVVFSRLNVKLNYMLLDESLDYLTFVDKKACFDILKNLSENNLIIVVDHNDQFKNLFDQRICVSYDGRATVISKTTSLS
jgi:DNA repair exonuclease SbcCD ATPase subunit